LGKTIALLCEISSCFFETRFPLTHDVVDRHSFNTSLPPLGDRERPRGGGDSYDKELFEAGGDINSKIKNYAARAGEDLEIYDFGGLRQELEEDDDLADQLIEENDDLNDVTFSVDVRKDGTFTVVS
jgi:hypothetical protein